MQPKKVYDSQGYATASFSNEEIRPSVNTDSTRQVRMRFSESDSYNFLDSFGSNLINSVDLDQSQSELYTGPQNAVIEIITIACARDEDDSLESKK